MPRSLILEPTRELAMQVAENFEKYGKYHKLSMALLIGGVQMGDQVKALEKGVDVLIATPGRLMDLFGRGKIMLNDCNLLVIDEADRMLDMGFIPDIEEICSKLPKSRQTLLFSATMPPPIQKLAAKFLNDPKRIEVARPATANVNIEQRLVEVRADKKRDALRDILRHEEFKNAIVFCNRKTTVRELATSLKRSGFAVGQIQGDMDQATASPSSTASRRTRSTSSSPPTSPRAGSTSKASATSSTSTCRGSPTITSTASAAPAAPA
jgi:superfamily II DNA/RNA helicase